MDETLCDASESCISDGLFGQCYNGDAGEPMVVEDLTLPQRALLRLELERLADQGLDWEDVKAQCVLAYYKLSVEFDTSYDTDFCSDPKWQKWDSVRALLTVSEVI